MQTCAQTCGRRLLWASTRWHVSSMRAGIDMRADMCANMRVGMRAGARVWPCVDMCAGMCAGMCADMGTDGERTFFCAALCTNGQKQACRTLLNKTCRALLTRGLSYLTTYMIMHLGCSRNIGFTFYAFGAGTCGGRPTGRTGELAEIADTTDISAV